jgi:insulysin
MHIVAGVVLLLALLYSFTMSDLKVTDVRTPVKSESDKREYRLITLPNKMECLLVHDAETDEAACAMDVGVGYMCDPDEIPGLAHFLEHMLFLGTEKYPVENSYNAFLSENMGRDNAYTNYMNTCYYLGVRPDKLGGAIDRFAQFFIAPLFTESATARELNAGRCI